jgi:hypothetical protein
MLSPVTSKAAAKICGAERLVICIGLPFPAGAAAAAKIPAESVNRD